MTNNPLYWSINNRSYSLFGQKAHRLNRFSWELPGKGIVPASPLSLKIQQLMEAGRPYGKPARIEVTTLGGLKLMLEHQLTANLLSSATCIAACLEVPIKVANYNRKLVIWSPQRSLGRPEVVITDKLGAWLKWG